MTGNSSSLLWILRIYLPPPTLPFLLSRSQTFLNVLKESWDIVLQAYWHRHWLFFFSLNLTIFRGIIISTIIIIILLSLLATLTYEALRQNWSESQAVTKSWFVSISLLNLQKKTPNSIFHTNNVIPKLVNELSQLKNFREIGSGTTKK